MSALLPRADAGWRQAASAKHRADFGAIAHSHGLTYEEYQRDARRWLLHHVATSEVRVRMRVANFEGFLRSGRYLTQYVVPFSGGAKHQGLRMMVEHTVLGVPTACRPADRPIYGYLSGSHEAGQIQQYGEVVLRLRPAVRNRATFVMGDSLDHAIGYFTDPAFVPQPVARPETLALLPHDHTSATCLGDACPPYGYAEAQIYGGLVPADLSEAVYTLGVQPTAATVALLGRLRVQWSMTANPGP